MKKMGLICGAVLAAMFFAGCTTVESTQKFNAIPLGTNDEKAVCQSYARITGFFFCGLPIFVGSPRGDNTCSMFCYNLTTENVMYLLTKEVKARGATRLINPSVCFTSSSFLCIFSYEVMQASGTGVRNRDAAVRQAAKDFENEP